MKNYIVSIFLSLLIIVSFAYTQPQPFFDPNHDNFTNLSNDTHTQYALLAGRSGGQSLIGGTASSESLDLSSTSNATKGEVTVNDEGADQNFRVEGDTTSDLIFADAGTDRVGIGTNIPNSTFKIDGSFAQEVRLVSTTPITAGDETVILADPTSASIIVNLPTAVGIAGRRYSISKVVASANSVTIEPDGSETLNGNPNNIMSSTFEGRNIVSDGSNWIILSRLN